MAETMRTQDLRVFFGDTEALKGVDLEIPAAAVTSIIGPSGCGKSALIRALNRMHDGVPGVRVSGRIYLGNREIHDEGLDPVLLRTRVGMVFQRPNPFPTMSIRQNITFAPRRHGLVQKGEESSLVEMVLRRTGLWDEVKDRLDHPAIALSSGQQQRICIARALAVRPQILLMDEPTAALDPTATHRIEALLYELKRDVTIVIVTHNMQQATRVSDYTAFFYVGEMVEVSKTSVIFSNPREERSREYLAGTFS